MRIRVPLAAPVVAALCFIPGYAMPAHAAVAEGADPAVVALRSPVAANAADARREPFRFEIKNNGPSTALNLTVEVDFAKADAGKISFIAPGGCANANRKVTCRLEPLVGNESMEFTLPVHGRGDRGPAGTLAVHVQSATADPRPENNAVRLPLEVGRPSFALVAVAFEVYGDKAKPPAELGPVPAGGRATLEWFLVNPSDRARKGIAYMITLPEHVT